MNKKREKFWGIILVFMTILISKTYYVGIKNETVSLFIYAGMAVVALFSCGFKIDKKQWKIYLCFLLAAAFSCVGRWLLKDSPSVPDMFKIMVTFLIVLLMVENYDNEWIATWFITGMTIMAVISLPCFYIANYMPDLAKRFYEPAGTLLVSPYYTWGWKSEFSTMWRNSGMFWEPGAFQGFLVIAILMLLFVKTRIVKKKITLAVLALALLTTQSTTGYMIILVILIFFWNDIVELIGGKANKNIWVMLRVILIIGIVLAFMYIYQSDIINNKFSDDNMSYTRRSGDLTNSLMLFKDRILFGYGLGRSKELAEAKYDIVNNSNGLFAMFYTYGILFSAVYVFLYIKGVLNFFSQKRAVKNVGLLIIMIMLQMTEGFWWLAGFLMFVACSYKKENKYEE